MTKQTPTKTYRMCIISGTEARRLMGAPAVAGGYVLTHADAWSLTGWGEYYVAKLAPQFGDLGHKITPREAKEMLSKLDRPYMADVAAIARADIAAII